MISIRSIAMSLLTISAFAVSACETTSMAAKSGPDSLTESARAAGTCARQQFQRSECDDHVGCFWDNEGNRCAAH